MQIDCRLEIKEDKNTEAVFNYFELLVGNRSMRGMEAEEAFASAFGEAMAERFEKFLDDFDREFFSLYQAWQENGSLIVLYAIANASPLFGEALLKLLKDLGVPEARMECCGEGFDVTYSLNKSGRIRVKVKD